MASTLASAPTSWARSGLNCYRFAAEAKVVERALGRPPAWWSPPRTTRGSFIGMEAGDGSKRSVAIYPLRNYEYVNLAGRARVYELPG